MDARVRLAHDESKLRRLGIISFDVVTLQFASRHLEIIRAFKERLTAPGYCYIGYTCSITRILPGLTSLYRSGGLFVVQNAITHPDM